MTVLTPAQKDALNQLAAAFRKAYEADLLDILAEDCHPDAINSVCDAVTYNVTQEAKHNDNH